MGVAVCAVFLPVASIQFKLSELLMQSRHPAAQAVNGCPYNAGLNNAGAGQRLVLQQGRLSITFW